jgi:RNA polymerase sigma factor (sigma-70 family)
MDAALITHAMLAEQNREISAAIRRERPRLRAFIRRRVFDEGDAEEILQDVLAELVAAYRLMERFDVMSAWLFRVARNRIVDLFRSRKRRAPAAEPDLSLDDADVAGIEELLPSPDAGPHAALARATLLEQLEEALGELPREQREVFIAHELEGVSFRDLAAASGVNVNTLLSRKRYAVLHLRQRLQAAYDDWLEE